MHDDGHFDEQVAARYDESASDTFDWHLEQGGCFIVEVMVPGLQRLPPGETVRPFHVGQTRWGFDSRRHVSVWRRPRRR